MNSNGLNRSFETAIKKAWIHPALSDHDGTTITYAELAERIARFHILFEKSGLKPGDHVALCGKNSINWAVAVMASITYGAVSVPILHDFKADTVEHLVSHSDSRLFFVEDRIWKQLKTSNLPELEGAISLNDNKILFSSESLNLNNSFSYVTEEFKHRYGDRFNPDDISFHDDTPEELALINYTSGSTGFSKGVMLTYGNLASNEQFAVENIPYLHADDGTISMLPMAHMFGLSIELFFPILKGCHIHFLSRVPAPSIILKAFAEVKPKLVIAVPLILEKIIKNKVFPVVEKPVMKLLLKIPGINTIIKQRIRRQLLDAFGGQLQQIVVGGAAFDKDVESFLRSIKFPYTVGYGMTECAPLISYDVWNHNHQGSVGRIVDRMQFKIDSPDPLTVPGEFWVKGANVMKGYYKNNEATEAVFKDGWMDTGDICQIDKDGYIYIRGRNKSIILGASGQNIYPEEIESKLNNLPFVAESLIVDRSGKLFALIHPDYEKAHELRLDDATIENQMAQNIAKLNTMIASYEQISGMEIMHEEFEKTPKRSIKRFLYK